MPAERDPAERDTVHFGYPVALDLHGVTVLVVGGGRIGARKAAALAAAGARVRLVASEISEHVDRSLVEDLREHRFTSADVDDVRLVVTATGDRDTDADVASVARSLGIWVNAADQPTDCDFILPAIARRGRVSVAVSTDGASPALARGLRDRIEALMSDRLAHVADELAAERAELHAAGRSTEDVDWSERIDRALDETFG